MSLKKLNFTPEDEKRLSVLKEYIDNILKYGSDKKGRAPIIADGIDRESKDQVVWKEPMAGDIVMSNLASQGAIMRIMDGLSTLTGESKYRDRVYDIYKYYTENGFADNGLIYWGGHAVFDMKTGEVKFASEKEYIAKAHELKNHYPYLKPFFDIDKEKTLKMTKAVWIAHMTDWKNLLFNRHGDYTKELDYDMWNKPEVVNRTKGLVPSQDLPFRASANDFIYMALENYKESHDEKALEWAVMLWEKYYNIYDKNTGMGGDIYTTIEGAEGVMDPMTECEPIGHWWDADPMPPEYTFRYYGDRAYNQFADQMIEEGYITPDRVGEICEPNVLFYAYMPQQLACIDLELAKAVGLDTPLGQKIQKSVAIYLSSYVKYAYDYENNMTKPIWANGIDMTGFKIKRNGYYCDGFYSEDGMVMEKKPVNPSLVAEYVKTYINIKEREDLKEYALVIWGFIRNAMLHFGLGDVGENFPGDKMKLNVDTSASGAVLINSLVYLYEETKIAEYIDVARKIADNMIEENFIDGLFVENKNLRYARFGGYNSGAPYALFMLSAAIKGEFENIEPYYDYDGFFNSDWIDQNGQYYWKRQDRAVLWTIEK